MNKFLSYLPHGYRQGAGKKIPAEVVEAQAIELGMDPASKANAVAKALAGGDWHCQRCYSQTQLISYEQGFRDFCSKKCSNNSVTVKHKKQTTSLSKFGTIFPSQSVVIRNKISRSMSASNVKTELMKFLTSNSIEFTDNGDHFSINNDVLRLYPLSDAFKYRAKMKGLIGGIDRNFFQEISIQNEKSGIKTIWIKPWEFKEGSRQRAVLQSTILAAYGKIHSVFNGRDCEVRELSTGELRKFLEINSFYGYRAASLSLGLYLKKDVGEFKKGTLLMIYTFGFPFFGARKGKYDVEVIRASTLLNCQVRGGASKLFKHFVTHHSAIKIGDKSVNWNTVCYYVDYDHNSGNSLIHLGFDFIEYSKPGFMNVETATGIQSHRQPARHTEIKKRILDGEMFSVYNAGVKVFIFTKGATVGPKSVYVGE